MRTTPCLILFLAVAIYSGAAWPQDTATYLDQQFGFRVDYPRAWQVLDMRGTNIRLYVRSVDQEEGCFFPISPVPSSVGQPLSRLVTIAMEPGAFERLAKQNMPNFRLLTIQRSSFGRQEAVVVTFANTVQEVGLNVEQRGVAALTWHGGYSYGGTCVASPEKFATEDTFYRGLLATFLFTQPKAG